MERPGCRARWWPRGEVRLRRWCRAPRRMRSFSSMWQAPDSQGATTWMPSGGPSSRALYRVDTRVARAPRKAFRFILMLASRLLQRVDQHDERRPDRGDGGVGTMKCSMTAGCTCTGACSVAGIWMRCRIREVSGGPPVSRGAPNRAAQSGARSEIIAKHAQTQAGIPGMYEDIVELYSHRRGNAGAARFVPRPLQRHLSRLSVRRWRGWLAVQHGGHPGVGGDAQRVGGGDQAGHAGGLGGVMTMS